MLKRGKETVLSSGSFLNYRNEAKSQEFHPSLSPQLLPPCLFVFIYLFGRQREGEIRGLSSAGLFPKYLESLDPGPGCG